MGEGEGDRRGSDCARTINAIFGHPWWGISAPRVVLLELGGSRLVGQLRPQRPSFRLVGKLRPHRSSSRLVGKLQTQFQFVIVL